jgi:membrane dipeptidase
LFCKISLSNFSRIILFHEITRKSSFSFFLPDPGYNFCPNKKQLHFKSIVADTHNDVISSVTLNGLNIEDDLSGKTHTDIARLKKGGVDIQVFSIFCDERYGKGTAFNYALREMDSLDAIVTRNPTTLMSVNNPSDLKKGNQTKKISLPERC